MSAAGPTGLAAPDGVAVTTSVQNADGTVTFNFGGGSFFDDTRYASYADTVAPDGTVLSEARDLRNGSQSVLVEAAGQTLEAHAATVFHNAGQADTTFVFQPGNALGVLQGFQPKGAGHDTLSLSGADFGNDLARVLLNTLDTAGGAVIFDPVTQDVVRLAGVTKAQARQPPERRRVPRVKRDGAERSGVPPPHPCHNRRDAEPEWRVLVGGEARALLQPAHVHITSTDAVAPRTSPCGLYHGPFDLCYRSAEATSP